MSLVQLHLGVYTITPSLHFQLQIYLRLQLHLGLCVLYTYVYNTHKPRCSCTSDIPDVHALLGFYTFNDDPRSLFVN